MPEKHHYLPVFYQKRWASSDGQACVYSRPHNKVKAVRRHPDRVGFERDLYTIPGVNEETACHLERRFFLQTDNDASQALAFIENETDLDQRLRSGWTRFIISLIHRAPEEVARFHRDVAADVEHAERKFKENYSSLRRSHDPQTYDEYRKLSRPDNPAGIATAMLIQKVIDSPLVGNHVNRMVWTVVSSNASKTFLTSDRPIIMTNGMSEPESHLALPIGPRKLFLASNTQDIVEDIARRTPDELISFVNDRVVRQARRFVIGLDDTQLHFIAVRFGEQLPSCPTEIVRPLRQTE